MVQIGAPVFSEDGGDVLISAPVTFDWPDTHIASQMWFRLPAETQPSPEAAADAYFQIGLPLAMGSGTTLRLEAPVSAQLVEHSHTLQDILVNWFPRKLRRAELEVTTRSDGPPTAPGTVSFFTAGTDSFYSAVSVPGRVTALAYVNGFDIKLDDTTFFDHAIGHMRAASADLGIPLVCMSTNLKRFTRHRLNWGAIIHGPALAAAGTLLHRSGGSLLIPSSFTYADLFPWGTHPLTERLRSTEYLQVIHDAAGVSRVNKLRQMADDPSVRAHLRVCWRNSETYNCGSCEKCLRTMTTLALIGKLDGFTAFPSTFSVERVRDHEVAYEPFTMENLRLARELGNAEMSAALRTAIRRARRLRAQGVSSHGAGATPAPETSEDSAAPSKPPLRRMRPVLHKVRRRIIKVLEPRPAAPAHRRRVRPSS